MSIVLEDIKILEIIYDDNLLQDVYIDTTHVFGRIPEFIIPSNTYRRSFSCEGTGYTSTQGITRLNWTPVFTTHTSIDLTKYSYIILDYQYKVYGWGRCRATFYGPFGVEGINSSYTGDYVTRISDHVHQLELQSNHTSTQVLDWRFRCDIGGGDGNIYAYITINSIKLIGKEI